MSDETWSQGSEATVDEMEQFYLPAAVNDGIKFVLTDNKGNNTDHWLLVRGRWSDAYQAALAVSMGVRGRESRLPDGVPRTPETELSIKEKAALIADWSFKQPCTTENVEAFFRKNIKLAVDVEILSWNEQRFFDK